MGKRPRQSELSVSWTTQLKGPRCGEAGRDPAGGQLGAVAGQLTAEVDGATSNFGNRRHLNPDDAPAQMGNRPVQADDVRTGLSDSGRFRGQFDRGRLELLLGRFFRQVQPMLELGVELDVLHCYGNGIRGVDDERSTGVGRDEHLVSSLARVDSYRALWRTGWNEEVVDQLPASEPGQCRKCHWPPPRQGDCTRHR